MRIVIVTPGSRGDVQPYLALGMRLKDAGHDVDLATHSTFEPSVRERGLGFSPMEGDPRALLTGEEGRAIMETGKNPILLLRRFAEAGTRRTKSFMSDCLEACRDAEAIVFSVPGFLAGYNVAEKLKVPFLPAYLQPVHPSRYMPNTLFPDPPLWLPLKGRYNLLTYSAWNQLFWQLIRRATNEARAEVLGLPPISFSGPFGGPHKGASPLSLRVQSAGRSKTARLGRASLHYRILVPGEGECLATPRRACGLSVFRLSSRKRGDLAVWATAPPKRPPRWYWRR